METTTILPGMDLAEVGQLVETGCKVFRGLSRMVVRGLKRVRSQVLWSALAYNLMHFAKVLIT